MIDHSLFDEPTPEQRDQLDRYRSFADAGFVARAVAIVFTGIMCAGLVALAGGFLWFLVRAVPALFNASFGTLAFLAAGIAAPAVLMAMMFNRHTAPVAELICRAAGPILTAAIVVSLLSSASAAWWADMLQYGVAGF